MIFVINLRLHEGTPSPAIVWFSIQFSSICFGEISQNFRNFWKKIVLSRAPSSQANKQPAPKAGRSAFPEILTVYSGSVFNLVEGKKYDL